MPCEHYKDALIEVAGSGAAPQGELRAHLSECASCRAAFDQEQSLFAAIDSGLHAAVNDEVPSSLLPHVRAQIDEVVEPRFRWLQPLVFASAAVALAFVVFLMALPHHAAPEEVAKHGPMVVPAPTVPATKPNPEQISSNGSQIAAIPIGHTRASRSSTSVHSAASSNVEILVPPDERQGLARLVDDLRQGQVLLADAKLQSQDLTIAPSEIVPIEMKALESAQPELR